MLENNVTLEGKTVLVTGAAGFIGSTLVRELLGRVKDVRLIGLDSITEYYDVNIKYGRLRDIENLSRNRQECLSGDAQCEDCASWTFLKGDISDREFVESVFREYRPSVVVNLAAQAGVRHSISHPEEYIASNITGFFHILEACRHYPVEHLVYASSSSVYGGNVKLPYSTDDKVDSPVSLYAATKRSNELMAHAYSKLYDIPSTGLRFFTVYGPAGRPDMAYFSFAEKMRNGQPVRIFNYGNCLRDFTYVDDVVEGICRVMLHAPEKRTGEDGLPVPPYILYNIGNHAPVKLLDFVNILQQELIRASVLPQEFEARLELVPMQPGDVTATYADIAPLERDFGYRPSTPLRDGLRAFAEWYALYCSL